MKTLYILKEYLKKHFINFRGNRISKRLLIIESDDWGSIRIPSTKAQEYLISEGLIKTGDVFSQLDILENESDYDSLFEVLERYVDSYGNHPSFTANMVMSNPDFERIKTENFAFFHLEPFTKTYFNYYPKQFTFEALKRGLDKKLFFPQFHAREHLNANRWMKMLQNGNKRYLNAFSVNCFAIDDLSLDNKRANLMATYDYQNDFDFHQVRESIYDGLQLFEQTFGFSSKTSIAPCYVWNDKIEEILESCGIKSLQGSYFQRKNVEGNHLPILHYMGEKNRFNQRYFVRNVLFEPAFSNKINWVDKAMESISISFLWGKPAIICSHRVNYVSGLSKNNRDNSLEMLNELLQKVMKKWPDIEFANSAKLIPFYS